MSKTNGQLITCDRCEATVFVKVEKECERDGGFTRWKVFEKAEGWTYESFIGDLCPKCSNEYECLQEEFKYKQKEFANYQKVVE